MALGEAATTKVFHVCRVKKEKKQLQRYQGKKQKTPFFWGLLLKIANIAFEDQIRVSQSKFNSFQVKYNHVEASV